MSSNARSPGHTAPTTGTSTTSTTAGPRARTAAPRARTAAEFAAEAAAHDAAEDERRRRIEGDPVLTVLANVSRPSLSCPDSR
jgi:hypothetical protein